MQRNADSSAPRDADVVPRILADLLPVIVRITDMAEHVLYLNAAWSRYTGLSTAESLGDGWRQALHPDDVAPFEAARAEGRRSNTAFTVEYRLRCADGVYRWHQSRAVPVPGSEGQTVAWLSATLDIDDRVQAERARDAVLGTVLHDLRAPLTTIIGRAQHSQRIAARLGDPRVAPLAENAARISATGKHMTAMLEELADLDRAARGSDLDLDRSPVDLVALVCSVMADAVAAHPDRDLRRQTPAHEVIVHGDAARLTRVVTNLLGNALKYTPAPAPLTVTVSIEQVGDARHALLRVRDEGIGIPAADLPHVFERYRRASNVGQILGTGIGLAGVKAIVEQHSGSVAVASTEGQGTTVTVRLPLGDPPRPTRE